MVPTNSGHTPFHSDPQVTHPELSKTYGPPSRPSQPHVGATPANVPWRFVLYRVWSNTVHRCANIITVLQVSDADQCRTRRKPEVNLRGDGHNVTARTEFRVDTRSACYETVSLTCNWCLVCRWTMPACPEHTLSLYFNFTRLRFVWRGFGYHSSANASAYACQQCCCDRLYVLWSYSRYVVSLLLPGMEAAAWQAYLVKRFVQECW